MNQPSDLVLFFDAMMSTNDALPEARSAELHSAVSPISNRQRVETFQRARIADDPQNAILRYGRVQLCAMGV
jgi:hypothetical protein